MSLPLELLPPPESFLNFSVPGVLRPHGPPGGAGAGLGATDDEAVEAEGGLELPRIFVGDFVRPLPCTEALVEGLPVEEGTRSDRSSK